MEPYFTWQCSECPRNANHTFEILMWRKKYWLSHLFICLCIYLFWTYNLYTFPFNIKVNIIIHFTVLLTYNRITNINIIYFTCFSASQMCSEENWLKGSIFMRSDPVNNNGSCKKENKGIWFWNSRSSWFSIRIMII